MPFISIEAARPTKEQKERLIAGLTKTASDILSVEEKYFHVLVKENDLDNWGVGGKPLAQFLAEQKNNGVGTIVKTYRFEIAPANLATFQKLISDEAIRAVRDDSGVMGAFVTAEQPNPNILHTMIIFSDDTAAQKYFASNAYKNYRRQAEKLIQAEKKIDYQPTKIHLSEKF